MHIGHAGGLPRAPVLGQFIEGQLSNLLSVSALPKVSEDKLRQVFHLLTAESLDQPAKGPFPGLSRINADGLPFQWVFHIGSAANVFGFLCEVGTPGQTPLDRYTLSLKRVRSAWDICGHSNDWLDIVANCLIPQSETDWPTHWRSALWIGVAPSAEGIVLKPYFNLNAGSARDRWLRAGRVLQVLGRNRSLAAFCQLSERVPRDCWPVGLAVDTLPNGQAGRVKIYFYSGCVGTDWLQLWYEAVGHIEQSPLVRRFLDLFPLMRCRRYPRRAFMIALEFHPSAEQVSIKTDLAVTKWMPSDAEITRAVQAITNQLGGVAQHVNEQLIAVGAHPPTEDSVVSYRFVGLGHEPDFSSHLNIYLAPAVSTKPSAQPRRAVGSISESLHAGVEFLLGIQRHDCWSDFDLPVGESNTWVTAYTLARLATVGWQTLGDDRREAISRSLDWLASARSPGGGWRYNSTVPEDADSTAWAILALRSYHRTIPNDARRFLLSCRQPTGWFATYPPHSADQRLWKGEAPDVSVAAMCALGEPWSTASESRFGQVQLKDGLIPAYWWTSPFYTMALLTETYPELSRSSFLKISIHKWESLAASEFDLALLLLIHSTSGGRRYAASIAEALNHGQRSDGSWPPSAVLRLPEPDMCTPWQLIDSGRLYRDINAVFTTATAVAALSRFVDSERTASECRKMIIESAVR